MKKPLIPTPTTLALATLLWASTSLLQAQELARFIAKPGPAGGCKVKIEGESTLHSWTMEGMIIGGVFELDSAFPTDPAVAPPAGKINAKATVMIPVGSVKSGKTIMDEKYQEALKVDQAPRITYKLLEMTLPEAPKNAADPLLLKTVGELGIAGTTNKVNMDVKMERPAKDKLKFTGKISFKMTEYKVAPPELTVAGVGIKTADEVTISFEWPVEKR